MANKMKTSTNSDHDTKKYCRKPMRLEMKAELMKFSDGMQNCDIYQKFNFSASTVATLPEDKSRILEVVRKASPLLFTVIQKHDELRAGMENILIIWKHDYALHCMSLSKKEIQAKAVCS
jgi:hypothetical protein